MANQPTLITLLLCEQVITEQNGQHTLVRVFTDIYAKKFPANHPRMVVFLAWLNNGVVKKSMLDIQIINNLKQPLKIKIKNHEVDFKKGKVGTFGIFNFNNTIFEKAGNYKIVVDLDGERIGELPIKVDYPKKQPASK